MTHPTLLTLDTTTEACSAALYYQGEIAELYEVLPRGHAQRILGMTDRLLAEAGLALGALDAIGVCRGPGSFTGVRIAVGVVQGMAFAADLPVAPVSTLATLAQGAYREHGATRVMAAIDARMGEVYWGGFALGDGVMREQLAECVCAPEQVPLPPPGEDWSGAGTGWSAYDEALHARCGSLLQAVLPLELPRARDIVPLAEARFRAGELVSAEQVLPIYLRDRVTG